MCSIAWDDSDDIPSDDAHTLVLQKSGPAQHITIGHSTLDSATPDKFLEIPSYMLAFGEKD